MYAIANKVRYGNMSGHGIFVWKDGSTYEGDFKDNNFDGQADASQGAQEQESYSRTLTCPKNFWQTFPTEIAVVP